MEHGRYNIEGDRDRGIGRERERGSGERNTDIHIFGVCGCACVSISLALALALYTHNHTWMNSWAFESHSVPIFTFQLYRFFHDGRILFVCSPHVPLLRKYMLSSHAPKYFPHKNWRIHTGMMQATTHNKSAIFLCFFKSTVYYNQFRKIQTCALLISSQQNTKKRYSIYWKIKQTKSSSNSQSKWKIETVNSVFRRKNSNYSINR